MDDVAVTMTTTNSDDDDDDDVIPTRVEGLGIVKNGRPFF